VHVNASLESYYTFAPHLLQNPLANVWGITDNLLELLEDVANNNPRALVRGTGLEDEIVIRVELKQLAERAQTEL